MCVGVGVCVGTHSCFLTTLHLLECFSASLAVSVLQPDLTLHEVCPLHSRVELSSRGERTSMEPSLPPNLLLLLFPALEGRTGHGTG